MAPASDRAHPTTAYARDVVKGSIPAGRLVRLACRRHLYDLKHGHKRGLTFDEAAADHAITFFGFLKHYKGEWAGQPFVLGPWQKFIVGSIFGWKRADGTRRFRVADDEVPRKNGKSTLAAGIGLYLQIADGEPGAEVYSVATKRDQAKIVFNAAKAMVKATPALAARIAPYQNSLVFEKTASTFQPLGADADTMDGLDVHGAIIDELHAHKTRDAFDVIDTGTGARRQPLLFIITTAGSDTESVCWEQHDYSIKILEGILEDDEWFAYIATIDEGDDWADPEAWRKANPNFGISVSPADLARKCKKAQATPHAQNSFRRLHLNEWTEQVNRWLDMAQWRKGGTDFDVADLAGRECFGGLDLSSRIDLSAFELVFPPEGDERKWKVLSYFFAPADNVLKRQRRDRVPYRDWIKAGYITATPGDLIDYDAIRDRINELGETYRIRQIGFDSWNATHIGTQLTADGFEMVEVRQGPKSMGGPSKDFEAYVNGARIDHGNNPVLTWMASSVTARLDRNDNPLPDKATSRTRIDGIVAAIMALGRAHAAAIDQPPPITVPVV